MQGAARRGDGCTPKLACKARALGWEKGGAREGLSQIGYGHRICEQETKQTRGAGSVQDDTSIIHAAGGRVKDGPSIIHLGLFAARGTPYNTSVPPPSRASTTRQRVATAT